MYMLHKYVSKYVIILNEDPANHKKNCMLLHNLQNVFTYCKFSCFCQRLVNKSVRFLNVGSQLITKCKSPFRRHLTF